MRSNSSSYIIVKTGGTKHEDNNKYTKGTSGNRTIFTGGSREWNAFTSGVIPIDPETNTLVEGDVTVQARQAIGNLKNLIEASGSSMDKVVKTTVFIKDMNDFGKINDIYKDFFTSDFLHVHAWRLQDSLRMCL